MESSLATVAFATLDMLALLFLLVIAFQVTHILLFLKDALVTLIKAPSNCTRLTVSPTTTLAAPEISTSYVRNNSVHIQVQNTIINGRTLSRFAIGGCDLTFVKLNNWLDLDCKDTFLASMIIFSFCFP